MENCSCAAYFERIDQRMAVLEENTSTSAWQVLLVDKCVSLFMSTSSLYVLKKITSSLIDKMSQHLPIVRPTPYEALINESEN